MTLTQGRSQPLGLTRPAGTGQWNTATNTRVHVASRKCMGSLLCLHMAFGHVDGQNPNKCEHQCTRTHTRTRDILAHMPSQSPPPYTPAHTHMASKHTNTCTHTHTTHCKAQASLTSARDTHTHTRTHALLTERPSQLYVVDRDRCAASPLHHTHAHTRTHTHRVLTEQLERPSLLHVVDGDSGPWRLSVDEGEAMTDRLPRERADRLCDKHTPINQYINQSVTS